MLVSFYLSGNLSSQNDTNRDNKRHEMHAEAMTFKNYSKKIGT